MKRIGLTSAAVVAVAAACAATAAGQTYGTICAGNPSVIVGTSGNDTLRGTPANDSIFAFGGNDTASGQAGNDCFKMGDGNDVAAGQEGNDTIYG